MAGEEEWRSNVRAHGKVHVTYNYNLRVQYFQLLEYSVSSHTNGQTRPYQSFDLLFHRLQLLLHLFPLSLQQMQPTSLHFPRDQIPSARSRRSRFRSLELCVWSVQGYRTRRVLTFARDCASSLFSDCKPLSARCISSVIGGSISSARSDLYRLTVPSSMSRKIFWPVSHTTRGLGKDGEPFGFREPWTCVLNQRLRCSESPLQLVPNAITHELRPTCSRPKSNLFATVLESQHAFK
jgi:hypothetical protein